jgi:hypothetical protein
MRLVIVIARYKDWFNVILSDKTGGWIHRGLLGSCASSTEDGAPRVYAAPSDTAKALDTVAERTPLALLDVRGAWGQFAYTTQDGTKKSGWMRQEALFSNPHNDCRVVTAAGPAAAPDPAALPGPAAPEEDTELLARAVSALTLIKNRHWDALAGMAHPDKGITFSPYASAGEGCRVFTPDKLKGLGKDTTLYAWGVRDGSGEPMKLTFADYYARFVYDKNYANKAKIGLNKVVQSGKTANGIAERFGKDAAFVEYHKKIDEQDGAGWGALRLVFEKLDGQWYLVGVVHDGLTT